MQPLWQLQIAEKSLPLHVNSFIRLGSFSKKHTFESAMSFFGCICPLHFGFEFNSAPTKTVHLQKSEMFIPLVSASDFDRAEKCFSEENLQNFS